MRSALFALIVLAAACGGSSSESTFTGPTTPLPSSTVPADTTGTASSADVDDGSIGSATAATAPPATAETTEQRLDGCPGVPAGSSSGQFDENAGTYAAVLTEFDPGSQVLSFDVVQWLSGPDAAAAYALEFPDEPDGPPNDYWVVNENDRVRSAVVAADADVLLVRLAADSSADVSSGTVDELAFYPFDGLSSPIWWLTFDGGVVTAVCEQYVP